MRDWAPPVAVTLSSRRGRRRLLTRLLTVSLTLVLGLALVVAWVRVVRTLLTPPDHTGLTGNVRSVVWNGRVFTTRAQLRSFLEARGLSYTRWAKAHPYAFTGRKPPATARRRAAAEKTKHPDAAKPTVTGKTAPVATAARSSVRAAHGGRLLPGLPGVATLVTVALAALALAAAALLFRSAGSLAPRASRALRVDAEARVTAFAAGLAILVGLAVARLFS